MPSKRHVIGYTLIEILVVLFIIGIVSGVVIMSIGRNVNQELKSFSEDFTQTFSLAIEQAMLKPAILGLTITKDSYYFSTYKPAVSVENDDREDNAKKSNWVPLTDKLLGKHTIPKGIYLRVVGAGMKSSDEDETIQHPQIIIATDGTITPFTIYVGKSGENPRYVIKGDASGRISYE